MKKTGEAWRERERGRVASYRATENSGAGASAVMDFGPPLISKSLLDIYFIDADQSIQAEPDFSTKYTIMVGCPSQIQIISG